MNKCLLCEQNERRIRVLQEHIIVLTGQLGNLAEGLREVIARPEDADHTAQLVLMANIPGERARVQRAGAK